jgi:glycosyltransferase involved in cell wall biosynthesis
MAAYNGELYITEQLQSILSQLAAEDEVIVVDDASSDATRQCVRSLRDGRIRLIEHGMNMGVSHTFEDAIRAASSSIVFLSDQDDLWKSRKVEVILDAFQANPAVTLVATDTAIIDSEGNLLSASYFSGKGEFRPGLCANLVRNRFGGCTMAFRAELIREILPLPHKYDVLHDIWIGVRNSLSGHRSLYIPEALVLNRRHSSTATGKTPLTIYRRVRNRLDLLLALFEFWMHRS